MVAIILDRVALCVGRFVLDGLAVYLLIAIVVALWDWIYPLPAPTEEQHTNEVGTAHRGFTVIRRRR